MTRQLLASPSGYEQDIALTDSVVQADSAKLKAYFVTHQCGDRFELFARAQDVARSITDPATRITFINGAINAAFAYDEDVKNLPASGLYESIIKASGGPIKAACTQTAIAKAELIKLTTPKIEVKLVGGNIRRNQPRHTGVRIIRLSSESLYCRRASTHIHPHHCHDHRQGRKLHIRNAPTPRS